MCQDVRETLDLENSLNKWACYGKSLGGKVFDREDHTKSKKKVLQLIKEDSFREDPPPQGKVGELHSLETTGKRPLGRREGRPVYDSLGKRHAKNPQGGRKKGRK